MYDFEALEYGYNGMTDVLVIFDWDLMKYEINIYDCHTFCFKIKIPLGRRCMQFFIVYLMMLLGSQTKPHMERRLVNDEFGMYVEGIGRGTRWWTLQVFDWVRDGGKHRKTLVSIAGFSAGPPKYKAQRTSTE
jgi:hypothetical protein